MNINGIWSNELGGAYGWEAIGTLFFRNGQISGGGRNHYAIGTYKTRSDGAVLHLEINQFGEKRPLFGQKSGRVCVTIKARRNGDKMIGEATLIKSQSGKRHYSLYVRFKRRASLPEEVTH